LDWETSPSIQDDGHAAWFRNASELDDLRKHLDHHGPFDAVVVKDLCKGVVSPATLEFLVRYFAKQKLPWFISTKAWSPVWLKTIESVNVRLFVVPQIAARAATFDPAVEMSRWIAPSGNVSREALRVLADIRKCFPQSPDLRIVVLSDDSNALALDTSRRPHAFVAYPIDRLDHHEVAVRMASAYFAALIANLLEEQPAPLETLLASAFADTKYLQVCDLARLSRPAGSSAVNATITVSEESLPVGSSSLARTFESELERWDRATDHLGILDVDGVPTLELWRSMLEVDGYVCLAPSSRVTLGRLLRAVEGFRTTEPRQTVSCQLIASPGSGKSYLVERLARQLGFLFLKFNITQMLSRVDIIDCFDTIVTTQAQNRHVPLLVFVDEINAPLGGQTVYDAFLAPLEEGTYRRASKTFYIDPCVWMFAGTKAGELDGPERVVKWSDFESRLTFEPFDLTTNNQEREACRTEKVYMGASLICSTFPDVNRIARNVLQLFHAMPLETSVRTTKSFVKSLRNVQNGTVVARNIVSKDSKLEGVDWDVLGTAPSDLIEIRTGSRVGNSLSVASRARGATTSQGRGE